MDLFMLLRWELVELHRTLSRAEREVYRSAGLTLLEGRVILEVEQHPFVAAADVAHGLRVSPSHICTVVGSLVRRRYLWRRSWPGDARRLKLGLTYLGRPLASRLRFALGERLTDVRALLADDESVQKTMEDLRRLTIAARGRPAHLRS